MRIHTAVIAPFLLGIVVNFPASCRKTSVRLPSDATANSPGSSDMGTGGNGGIEGSGGVVGSKDVASAGAGGTGGTGGLSSVGAGGIDERRLGWRDVSTDASRQSRELLG